MNNKTGNNRTKVDPSQLSIRPWMDGRRPSDHAERIRAVKMRPGDLFRDPRDGLLSLVKTCAMLGFFALVAGFVTQAQDRNLDWMDYIGFSLSVTIISGAPIASNLISIMAPRLSGIPAPTPPAGSPPPSPPSTP